MTTALLLVVTAFVGLLHPSQADLTTWGQKNAESPVRQRRQYSSCGGTLTLTNSVRQGYIMSPNFPGNYPTNIDCSWIINAPSAIKLDFVEQFYIEPHSNCNYDFVKVLEGGTTTSPVLGTFCGTTLPATVRTVGRTMTVRFRTDGSVEHAGFKAKYSIACGGTLTLTNSVRQGYIMSPNFPGNYPTNIDCSWIINAPSAIKLDFVEQFYIEPHSNCNYDFVKVLEGGTTTSPVLGTFCGTTLPATVRTVGRTMTVRFRTDGSVEHAGFKAKYSIACGGTLTLTNSVRQGYIMSPNFPGNYPTNIDCSWIINAPSAIKLDFVEQFYIEPHSNCNYDFVKVLEGGTTTSPVLGTFCGTTLPATVRTVGRTMTVRFRTDGSVEHAGFKAKYSIVTCPSGWYPTGYVCYRAFDEVVSWTTADTRCRREGGRLASVKSAETHNFLVALKNTVDPNGNFWIGLNDRDQEGVWMWTDGMPVGQFEAWNPGEPTNSWGLEHCGHYGYWGQLDIWNDVDCNIENNFICEQVNPPVNVTCSLTTTSSFVLHWLYPYAPTSGYHIWYHDVLDDVEPIELTSAPAAGNVSKSVVIGGLKSGCAYNVTLRAVVGTTESLDNIIECITETDTPQSLACAGETSSSVTVSWTRPQAPLIAYKVNFTSTDHSAGSTTTITAQVGPANQSYVLQDAEADREYHVTLVALGLYKDSLPVTVTCGTMTPPPDDCGVQSITSTSVTVSWTQVSSSIAIGYRVWIRTWESADIMSSQLLPTRKTEVTFTDLTPATKYIVSAASINPYIEGTEVNVTVATETDPPPALDVGHKTTDTVVISWHHPKAVLVSYSVTYTGNGRSTSIVKPGDVNSCELTGLTPGTWYSISLVAISRLGRSIAVNTSVVTDTDPPSSLAASRLSTTWMFLVWTPSRAEILSYELTVREAFSSTGQLFSVDGSQTSYNVTNLLPDTEYVINMAAVSEHGQSVEIMYSNRTDSVLSMDITTTALTHATTDAYTSLKWSDAKSTKLSTLTSTTEGTTATNSRAKTQGEFKLDGGTTTPYRSSKIVNPLGNLPQPSTQSLQTSQPLKTHGFSDPRIYRTPLGKTTESLTEEKLQHILQSIGSGDLEVATPEDILSAMKDMNKVLTADNRSSMTSSAMQTTTVLVKHIVQAAGGTQSASVPNLESMTKALVETSSTVIQKLPEAEKPITLTAYSDNLLKSDVIDVNSVDLSPKQQLKMVKARQKERQDMEHKASLSIVASLDRMSDLLLRLQPVDAEYQKTFSTLDVGITVSRSPSDKDLILNSSSSNINATILRSPNKNQPNSMMDVKMSVFKKNPYSWRPSTGGQDISSPVTILSVTANERGIITEEQRVNLDIPFLSSQGTGQAVIVPQATTTNQTAVECDVDVPTNGTSLTYHAFKVPNDHVIPVVHMSWPDTEAIFNIYIMYGSRPTVEKFAEKRVIQGEGLEAWFQETNYTASFTPRTTYRDGVLYIGVQNIDRSSTKQDIETGKETKAITDYSLWMDAIGCSSWEDNKEQWTLGSCDANLDLVDNVLHCQCHMTGSKVALGTTSLPVPNSIDFINAFNNFSRLADNALVFSSVVFEWFLYILFMLLLHAGRIKSAVYSAASALQQLGTTRVKPFSGQLLTANIPSKALSRVCLIPPDRMPASFIYQLTVTTGAMFGAGTTSRVGFQLFGSLGKTAIKILNPGGEALLRGSTLHFIMPVRESLGQVMLLHIWHDNSGDRNTASWFLGTVVVRDLEMDVAFYFICNDWLSENKGDGEVQKVVHASTERELTSFTSVFSEATRDAFYEQQLWASAIVTAPGSSFTQAQRLSCCFTLLNTMMLASAMWYKAEDTTADTRVYNLGIVRFTVQELYISLMSILTVLPVNLMVVQLFRMRAPLSVNTPEMTINTSKQGSLRQHVFRLAKFVAWLTVFLVSISSSFFIILYSLDWGQEKSDAWMKAFILSFLGSSCVVDTLQIFVLGVVIAAICGLPFLMKPLVIRREHLQLNLWNTTPPKIAYPPIIADRQSARKKKELRKKSGSVLWEFLLLFIFVVVLFYIAQKDKDQLAFHETQALSNNILNEYDEIRTPDQFYIWVENVLLPTLYPSDWYNGRRMKVLDQQFAQNTKSFRLGPPHLTQVRQHPGSVDWEKDAGLGWKVFVGNTSNNCWRFEGPNLMNQPNYTSDCANHHSLDFPLSYNKVVSFFKELRTLEFFHKYTKSLTIDINFYNPSLKLFSVVSMVVENFAIGNLMPTATITSFRLFQYESDADYVDMFMHIVFVLLFLVIIVKEFKAVRNMGWKYFTSWWNALSCLSLIGTATMIAVFIKRYAVASDTLVIIRKTNGELGFECFVSLATGAYWDACFKHILGIVVFINTIALLRVVGFSQTIGKLLALPGIMKEELMSFSVVAAIAFMAFISSAYLIFATHMESYSDLYHTTFALFEMMLGRFFANEMLDSNPLTGPIFFTTFMIVMFILLMYFLMTIICDAISADVKVDQDRELADHMWRSFCAMMGFHIPPNKEDIKPGALKIEKLQANLRIIRDQLDKSLDICDSVLQSSRQINWPYMQTARLPTRAPGPATCLVIHTDCGVTINIEDADDCTMETDEGIQVPETPANTDAKKIDIAAEIQNRMEECEMQGNIALKKLGHNPTMDRTPVENIALTVIRSTAELTHSVEAVSGCSTVVETSFAEQHARSVTQESNTCHSRNMWIPDLRLTAKDKAVLLSDEELTDKHIHAAQMLLHRQHPGLGGLQDTAVGASPYGYARVSGEGLQIHHTGSEHWVVSSSVGGHVSVYDSNRSRITASLEYQLCQCYAPLNITGTNMLTVKVPRVQLQRSHTACGLFAIAWAVDVAMGTDVTQVRYDESRMRAHLLHCFEKRELSPFPRIRRIISGQTSADHRITLVCCCHHPSGRLGGLVKCKICRHVFHRACYRIKCRTSDTYYLCLSCTGKK